ncbi:MAG: class C beta-lactamase-related serine hydrolase [Opitutae bacterium]|nr:class C beta-lactamase-related serine hydrolase [Opitutae bacterium]
MKTAKRVVAIVVVLFLALKYSPYSYLIRGVQGAYLDGHKSAHIYDRSHFDQREMPVFNAVTLSEGSYTLELSPETRTALESYDTKGLIVLEKDSVVLEEYWDDHDASTISNSFSTAKTVITLLIQIAIQDGYIDSWDDPITKYIPEYEIPEGVAEPTLRHFSTMTAGMQIKENYNDPFSKTAKLYYGDNAEATALSVPPGKHPTGEVYEYQSAQTQVLTVALSRAVGESVSSFANRELFAKVGFEVPATWHLDRADGLELGFCCLNVSVRDFAKLGQFILHDGKINGQPVVDSAFIAMASQGYKSPYYGHSFWIYPEPHNHVFGFRGMLGQDILIDRAHQRVVMRVGQRDGGKYHADFNKVEEALLLQMDLWNK